MFSSSTPHRALSSFPTRRSSDLGDERVGCALARRGHDGAKQLRLGGALGGRPSRPLRSDLDARVTHDLHHVGEERSEEHTSELQSRQYLVCRLLLEKKKLISNNQ